MKKRLLVGLFFGAGAGAIAAAVPLLFKFGREGALLTGAGCLLGGLIAGFVLAPWLAALDPAKRKKHPFRFSLLAAVLATLCIWPVGSWLLIGLTQSGLSREDFEMYWGMMLFGGWGTWLGWAIHALVFLSAPVLTAWDERNRKALRLAGGLFGLALAACAVTGLFFIGQHRVVTRQMTWQYGTETPERFAAGFEQNAEKALVISFADHPDYYMTAFSNELAGYLETVGPRFPITFKVRYDFGQPVSREVLRIGDRTDRPLLDQLSAIGKPDGGGELEGDLAPLALK